MLELILLGAMCSKTKSKYLKKSSKCLFFKKVVEEHLAYAKYLLTVTPCCGDNSDITV